MRHQFVNCIKNLLTSPKQGEQGLRLALTEYTA